jgi:hypothetical protein
MVVLLAVVGALAGSVEANRWKIVPIKGEGVELCEICMKNLRRVPDDPGCDRNYDARLGLQEPEWDDRN